jgi:hypothetical protein
LFVKVYLAVKRVAIIIVAFGARDVEKEVAETAQRTSVGSFNEDPMLAADLAGLGAGIHDRQQFPTAGPGFNAVLRLGDEGGGLAVAGVKSVHLRGASVGMPGKGCHLPQVEFAGQKNLNPPPFRAGIEKEVLVRIVLHAGHHPIVQACQPSGVQVGSAVHQAESGGRGGIISDRCRPTGKREAGGSMIVVQMLVDDLDLCPGDPQAKEEEAKNTA